MAILVGWRAMNGVAAIVEKFRDDKDELQNRCGETRGREPNRTVLSLDDYLRLVADIVQASILRNRAKWLDSLVAIVKNGEYGVDPFDQSRVPKSSADAAVKLLCIFTHMAGDDIFADAEEQFPQPTWDGKERCSMRHKIFFTNCRSDAVAFGSRRNIRLPSAKRLMEE